MSEATRETGSFRDPAGHVYLRNCRVFRTVLDPAVADFEFVQGTGLIDRLVADGLVLAAEIVAQEELGDAAKHARYVLEHPRLPFVSYPYEWPFSMLKAAALTHLDVHLRALEHGVTLSDASAYNLQFIGHRPVFIDRLSFRRYRDGEFWAGHRQFCEQFLNPLLLRAVLGVTHNAWYRGSQEGIAASDLRRLLPAHRRLSWNILTHVVLQSMFQASARTTRGELDTSGLSRASLPLASFRRMLEGLRRWIDRLRPADVGKTVWADYNATTSYDSAEADAKRRFIAAFAAETRPSVLWDLGCNTGEYTQIALQSGAAGAVGFDIDQGALEAAYARARAERINLLPVYFDAANPSPDQGWAQRERHGLAARTKADAVMALAFIHHLAIARNIPLKGLISWITEIAGQGVIEFVPKQDPRVQELLRHREDIFPDYDADHFLACIRERAVIVKSETISASGRLLVWYRRSDRA